MSKQIYIDSNGNEVLVSGTVNTADMMPMSASDSTKVATAIGDLSTLTTSVTSSLVGALNDVDAKIKNYSTTGAVAQICTIGSYYQSKIGHICSFELEVTLTSNAVFNTTIVSIPAIPKLTNVPILAYSPDLGANVNLIIDIDGNIHAISNINSGVKLRIAGTILV